MPLQYKPFEACVQLVAASRAGYLIRNGRHGAAVRVIQGALIELGYPMPRSIRKFGAPDGFFGYETENSVRRFQSGNKLRADGIVGRNTLAALDSQMVEKSKPVVSQPPLARPSQTSLEYMLGEDDPPIRPDYGGGPWNSKPTQASYVALRLAIIDVLPSSAVLVGDDAVAHLWHYLRGSGAEYMIDLAGMLEEVPSARARYQ